MARPRTGNPLLFLLMWRTPNNNNNRGTATPMLLQLAGVRGRMMPRARLWLRCS